MSDNNSVDVSNNPWDNYPKIPVAAKLLNSRRYQGIILCDASGNEIGVSNPLPVTASVTGTPNVNVSQWAGLATEYQSDDFSTPHPSIVVQGWNPFTNFPTSIPCTNYGVYSVLTNSSGNEIATATGAPGSSDRGMVVRQPLAAATTPAYGKIAGTSLTTSYATLLSMSNPAKTITLMNSCDQAVIITLDNGTTNNLELDAFEAWTHDFAANSMYLSTSTIKAKHTGTLPKVGSIRCWITT